MYQEYRKNLAGLVKAIAEENGLEEENQVLIMHLLDSKEKIVRFNEWLESRLVGEKLQATEAEICRAAVQAAKENIQDEPKSAKNPDYTSHVIERADRAVDRYLGDWLDRLSKEDK